MQKSSKIALVLASVMCIFFYAQNSHAWSAPEDMTKPFEYGSYTVNMPLILAQDSVFWDLLDDFNSLRNRINCRTKTESFIAANRSASERIFPWFGPSNSVSSCAIRFCDILSYIPGGMRKNFQSAGFTNPAGDGQSTNLFDSSVVPNWNKVENFVLDHPLVRIEFSDDIDLLSYNL